MKRRILVCGLSTAGMTLLALVGSGVAQADSDPTMPSGPGIIDQMLTETPALFVNPDDEGGPSRNWDGVGMYCENQFVRCR